MAAFPGQVLQSKNQKAQTARRQRCLHSYSRFPAFTHTPDITHTPAARSVRSPCCKGATPSAAAREPAGAYAGRQTPLLRHRLSEGTCRRTACQRPIACHPPAFTNQSVCKLWDKGWHAASKEPTEHLHMTEQSLARNQQGAARASARGRTELGKRPAGSRRHSGSGCARRGTPAWLPATM